MGLSPKGLAMRKRPSPPKRLKMVATASRVDLKCASSYRKSWPTDRRRASAGGTTRRLRLDLGMAMQTHLPVISCSLLTKTRTEVVAMAL